MAHNILNIQGTSLAGPDFGTKAQLHYHDDVQDDGIVAGISSPDLPVSIMLTLDDAIAIRDALTVAITTHGED